MDAAGELGRNPASTHQIQPENGDEQADVGRELPNPSCETKFSGANGDMELFIFPVQLTTSRIRNLWDVFVCRVRNRTTTGVQTNRFYFFVVIRPCFFEYWVDHLKLASQTNTHPKSDASIHHPPYFYFYPLRYDVKFA